MGFGHGKCLNLEEQKDIILFGIELGMNCLDTSETYQDGKSEIFISSILKKIPRDKIFISDKVAPENLKYKNIINSCNKSLFNLKTDYIDLYQIHWPNPLISEDEISSAMMKLKEDGKILDIGVCNTSISQLQKYHDILENNLYSLQIEYNLAHRFPEQELIPFCDKNDIKVIAYSPLKKPINIDILQSICNKYNKTLNQITLNWIISNSIYPIFMSNNKDHILENFNTTLFSLEQGDIDKINLEYEPKVLFLKPKDIICELSLGSEKGKDLVYKSKEEAIENKYDYKPSPVDLSDELKKEKKLLKPIYIKYENNTYKLITGNVRYWAWVLAFGLEEEIECVLT